MAVHLELDAYIQGTIQADFYTFMFDILTWGEKVHLERLRALTKEHAELREVANALQWELCKKSIARITGMHVGTIEKMLGRLGVLFWVGCALGTFLVIQHYME